MSEALAAILQRLTAPLCGESLSGLHAGRAFDTTDETPSGWARRINAAFLLRLCGPSHPQYAGAESWWRLQRERSAGREVMQLYDVLLEGIGTEWHTAKDDGLGQAAEETAAWCKAHPEAGWDAESQQRIWSVFFPEGVPGLVNPEQAMARLRAHRRVEITRLNPHPLHSPADELILTSNVLLTVPHDRGAIDRLPYSGELREHLRAVADEPQLYWYDHPIPIGVEPAANEILYGLHGLDEAVAFEKAAGRAPATARLRCILSVSVTHRGLQAVAVEYLKQALAEGPPLRHLEVYAFTEQHTRQLLEHVLEPCARAWHPQADLDALRRVFGVNGEHGRHYSFLKAMPALWQVMMSSTVRATFKIDLDQVFPQHELVEQGGGSAFEHFSSPLWGAEGRDDAGRAVHLGMLAGALVNQRDIHKGLFTPDVPWPDKIPAGEAVVFFNRLPMALSTRAEMMTRYDSSELDGRRACLHRIHLTGGTNGILLEALRRYRPFTPSFIGRAEDQAYLLSVLFEGAPHLRYAHEAGLIMRHDKEAFAGHAIEAAKSGRFVGDLVRTLLFSRYVEALPWSRAEIKDQIDPFTGCFASRIPVTLVGLRLALAVEERFAQRTASATNEALEMQAIAAQRLVSLMTDGPADAERFRQAWEAERRGWQIFYDTLDQIEQTRGSTSASAPTPLIEDARKIIESCRVT